MGVLFVVVKTTTTKQKNNVFGVSRSYGKVKLLLLFFV